MAQDTGLPDIQLDGAGLYREDIFTDRKAGTIRRLMPVTADGHTDPTRTRAVFGSDAAADADRRAAAGLRDRGRVARGRDRQISRAR